MSIAGDLIKGGAQGILGGLGDIAVKIREAIKGKEIPPELTVKLQEIASNLEATTLQAETQFAMAQVDLLKIDAQSEDWFQRRWRPALGWMCVAGWGYVLFIQTMLPWVLRVAKVIGVPDLPAIPSEVLWVLTGANIPLIGARSYDKWKRGQNVK